MCQRRLLDVAPIGFHSKTQGVAIFRIHVAEVFLWLTGVPISRVVCHIHRLSVEDSDSLQRNPVGLRASLSPRSDWKPTCSRRRKLTDKALSV